MIIKDAHASLITRTNRKIKQISGYILIVTALAFHFHWFRTIEIWAIEHTPFGNLGVDLEQKLFGEEVGQDVLENL